VRKPEKIVHKILLRRARSAVHKIYDVWKIKGRVPAIAFLWAGQAVKTDDGKGIIDDLVMVPLPDNPDIRQTFLRDAAQKVRPCAVLVLWQEPGRVLASFESDDGAVSWTCDILPCGNSRRTLARIIESKGETGLLSSLRPA